MSYSLIDMRSPRHRVVFLGTSITFGIPSTWFPEWVTEVQAAQTTQWGSLASAPWTAGLFATAGVKTDLRLGGVMSWVNSGLSGDVIANMDANYSTRVAQFAPTVLVVEAIANDVGGVPTGVGASTDPTVWGNSLTSLCNKTRADFPTCQIVVCTGLVYGEDWPTGANVRDTAMENISQKARDVAFAAGYAMVDWRATTYAAQEPALNPGHAVGGVAFDTSAPGGLGLHPLASTHTRMCNLMLAQTLLP